MLIMIRRACALVLASFCVAAAAQSGYPNKPVRIIVPFPPGGATDILGREIGEKLGAALGQTFVVENRAGASGNIGMEAAARAAPDGYTLVIGSAQSLTINPQIFKNLSFSPQRDLSPIAVIASVPNVLIVSPKSPATSVKELIALAQVQPGRLNYGSSSVGGSPHLSSEMLKVMTRTYITHIPYRGSAPALQDLIGGQIDMMIDNLPAALPHIRSGRVRALGVTTLKRTPTLPEVPTLDEAGLKGFDSQGWFAVLAPAGTPQPIVDRLNAEVNKALATPGFRERLSRLGADPVGGSVEDFRKRMRDETERWGKVIRYAQITAD